MGERYNQFRIFHMLNPQVFEVFKKFAHEARAAGRTRFSAHMIGNRMRWYTQVEVQSDDGYKINNNHLPYYAKLLMLKYSDEFDGFFQRRDRFYDTTDAILLEECG